MDSAHATESAAVQPLHRWRRAGGFIIECLIWATVGSLVELPEPTGTIMVPIVVLAQLLYRAYMYHRHGGVLGHLAVSGRVRDHSTGQAISHGQAWGRAAAGLLDLLVVPVLVNAVMVLARDDRRHLYDLLAGTVVTGRE